MERSALTDYIDREIAHAESELRTNADLLTRRMELMIELLDEDMPVNALGEVQSLGREIDAGCAKRQTLIECRRVAERQTKQEQASIVSETCPDHGGLLHVPEDAAGVLSCNVTGCSWTQEAS